MNKTTPKTLKELCDDLQSGNSLAGYSAYKEIHARFSREVALVVLQALESNVKFYEEDMPEGPEKADLMFVTKAYRDAYANTLHALALLNGTAQRKEGTP